MKALINTMQPDGTERVSLVASGYDERVMQIIMNHLRSTKSLGVHNSIDIALPRLWTKTS